jgi:hypothetical protein
MKKNAILEDALRRSVPDADVPSALHVSIMDSVRLAGAPAPFARKWPGSAWLLAPAVALIVCAASAWHLWVQPALRQRAVQGAGTALIVGQQMARAVPGTALSPLMQEWQRLNKDLDNTAQFLLAAVP